MVNEGNQLLQPELESKGGNDSEAWPKPCQKSVPAEKLNCDYYRESEW